MAETVWHDLEARFEITAEMFADKSHALPQGFMWYVQFDTCAVTPWNGVMIKPGAVQFKRSDGWPMTTTGS
jgi:hypothetical protein